jgi:hypothetical protein
MKNSSKSIVAFVISLTIALAGAFASSSAQTTTSQSVPVGTELKIRLENDLDTKKNKTGDTFTAIVLSPDEYMDSTVEGHVAQINQSGKIKGQTQLALAFDRIKLTNGQTIPIDAQVTQIYSKSGKQVDEEGNVKSGSQGKSTAVRTGGGAAVGAIIGGIAGGGKGAAIGSIVGGGAGVGSKVITGPQQVKLPAGTEVLIKTTK